MTKVILFELICLTWLILVWDKVFFNKSCLKWQEGLGNVTGFVVALSGFLVPIAIVVFVSVLTFPEHVN